jgi:hypothetical protein
MSERARDFVESWKDEYLHPVTYEPEGDLSESKANAAACYDSAAIEGISKAEIDEEYEDLIAEFVSSHEKMIDAEVKRLADKDG